MGIIKKMVDEAFMEREQKGKQQSEQKEKEEHFSIKQLAEFLGCSKVSIHKYKKKGLPFYRIGRKILFRKQEVLNFMRSLGQKRIIEA